jgi:N-acetylglutamate synthase-like GNAT family acetyltransferase
MRWRRNGSECRLRRVASALDLTSAKIAGLARYWEAKRGQRAMPTWADFDPAEIKPLLPHLMVTRYERNPFRIRYSLIGTFVVQYGGADFTGQYLDEMEFPSEVDTDWTEVHSRLVAEAQPVFGICIFMSESGLQNKYEVAMFPIADPTGNFVERGVHIEDFPLGARFVPDQDAIALKPIPSASAARDRAVRAVPAAAPRLEAVEPSAAEFRRCLEEAKLPTVDLMGADKVYFCLMEGDDRRAYGGFEIRGSHALLRSIVVEGRHRGHGYGRSLVLELIAEAGRRGLREAWLLTNTAAAFFASLGFTPSTRESAPPEIAATKQFAELCPASAKLMRREIT